MFFACNVLIFPLLQEYIITAESKVFSGLVSKHSWSPLYEEGVGHLENRIKLFRGELTKIKRL